MVADEELGITYQLVQYQREPKSKLAPPAYRKLHPIGTAPIITDGDITLTESGAIIEYVLYRYGNGRLVPALGTKDWAEYLFWLHFVPERFMPNRLLALVFELVHRNSPFFIKPITSAIKKKVLTSRVQPRLTQQLNYVEATLEQTEWLAGDEFTAADIQMGVAIILSSADSQSEISRPKLMEYVARIENRPAYERAMEVAGPLRFSR